MMRHPQWQSCWCLRNATEDASTYVSVNAHHHCLGGPPVTGDSHLIVSFLRVSSHSPPDYINLSTLSQLQFNYDGHCGPTGARTRLPEVTPIVCSVGCRALAKTHSTIPANIGLWSFSVSHKAARCFPAAQADKQNRYCCLYVPIRTSWNYTLSIRCYYLWPIWRKNITSSLK